MQMRQPWAVKLQHRHIQLLLQFWEEAQPPQGGRDFQVMGLCVGTECLVWVGPDANSLIRIIKYSQ